MISKQVKEKLVKSGYHLWHLTLFVGSNVCLVVQSVGWRTNMVYYCSLVVAIILLVLPQRPFRFVLAVIAIVGAMIVTFLETRDQFLGSLFMLSGFGYCGLAEVQYKMNGDERRSIDRRETEESLRAADHQEK